MTAHDVIIRPVISEESMDGIARGRYTFIVRPDATKTDIKRAVEEAFKVKVVSVNTLRTHGKRRRMGRYEGRTPDQKKAVVKLAPGSKIEFFEGLV
ncbi:MAG: 50S ribosomal protein L23 [Clostridia bacterium]|nr:50S ribosomal protein L23 [Clostridia bacterium]